MDKAKQHFSMLVLGESKKRICSFGLYYKYYACVVSMTNNMKNAWKGLNVIVVTKKTKETKLPVTLPTMPTTSIDYISVMILVVKWRGSEID